METIALFGGSFDPPHIGHEAIVKSLCNFKDVDKVIVMPKANQKFDFYFLKKLNIKSMKLGTVIKDIPYGGGCRLDLVYHGSIASKYSLRENDVIKVVNDVTINTCSVFKRMMSGSNNLNIQLIRRGVFLEATVPLSNKKTTKSFNNTPFANALLGLTKAN